MAIQRCLLDELRNSLCQQALLSALLFMASLQVHALELPSQQSALAFNFYSGDELSIDSQYLSARTHVFDQYSLGASFQHDSVNDASIDFRHQATYVEDRDTAAINGAYLYESSLFEMSFAHREESDYEANTLSFDISQSVLSGLTTWHMGYSRAWDTLGKRDSNLDEEINRHKLRLGLTQVLSRQWNGYFNYELMSDNGRLDNPYIGAIINDASVLAHYPSTRIGHAFSASLLQYLRRNTVAKLHYRYFRDSWDIQAHSLTLNYTAPLRNPFWHLDYHVRGHRQSAASFYSNNADQFTRYISRDKKHSSFYDMEIGLNARIDLSPWFAPLVQKLHGNIAYTAIFYTYLNYSDPRTDKAFAFRADVFQCYITAGF
ncbi:MAG: DUF3570 domain-containing protein [Pseudomonadales bacterium]|nr:DUF3570 domain-containing protein [Pseudomonadales bacterium]